MQNEDTVASFSAIRHTLAYLCVFIGASVLTELLRHFVTFRTIIPGLFVIGVCTALGTLFLNERNVLSRITSAATLLVLSIIALRIDHTVIPNAYLFTIALGVSILGAQSALHQRLTSPKRTALSSISVVVVTLIAVSVFTYGVTVLSRVGSY